jgi:outer membrane immunogenic protein
MGRWRAYGASVWLLRHASAEFDIRTLFPIDALELGLLARPSPLYLRPGSEGRVMRAEHTTSWIAATLWGAAAIGLPAMAQAADIPPPIVKAPVSIPAETWTGFYLSGGIGRGLWSAETFTSDPAPFLDALPLVQRHGGSGWLGRIGGGYDYQFTQRIVAGLFADFDFSSLKGTVADPRVSLSGEIKQTHSWAIGARAGWLMNPTLLSYFTAGYTDTRFSSANMDTFSTSVFQGYSTPSFSRGGWFLGGGTETALGGGWFGRTEYRYAYYGDQVLADTSATPPAPFFSSIQNIHFKPTVQTVTAQLVYKLNTPGSAQGWTVPATARSTNWTGGYVNGGVGYGLWAADESTTAVPGAANPPVVVAQRLSGKGWFGRAGVGYDYQFSPRIVGGVFGDFDISSLKGTIQDAGAGLAGETKQTWSWAAGGRIGWLIAPDTLSYINVGYTEAHYSGATMNSMVTAAPFFGLTTPAFTASGWFSGGGVEAAIAPGWFWRNEYRYAEYGNESVTDSSSDPAAGIRNRINFKPRVQTVTTQLVYKFNWGR